MLSNVVMQQIPIVNDQLNGQSMDGIFLYMNNSITKHIIQENRQQFETEQKFIIIIQVIDAKVLKICCNFS